MIPLVKILFPVKVLDAVNVGISVSSILISTVLSAPLSITLLPKLELSDLSFERDAVKPITT